MWSVLIVDDDRNITRLLDFAFQQAGFFVMIARDGTEGYSMATQHPPDVAVLDVMMPGIHGYELCRRLRADPKTTKAKIVFLTARTQSIDEQEALKAGADVFLSKPVLPNELVLKVQSLLEGTVEGTPSPTQTVVEPEETPEPEPETVVSQPSSQVVSEPQGRLIACWGGSAGVGVTTVAANLAIAFSLLRRTETPLVELHSSPGNLLPVLGLASGLPYGDLKATGSLLTWDTLPLHLMDHSTGVRVLPAPPLESDVPVFMTERAIVILRSRFPVVVADASSQLDERVRSILLSADLILLVLTPEVSTIRASWDALQQLRALQYPQRQILLVLNHVLPQATVPVARIGEGIKYPILTEIPYEESMETMVDIGKPVIVTQPQSRASLAIGRAAAQLARGLG
jgi:pilus assembly protein CpaE